MGAASLGWTSWPGTSALHVTPVDLIAPEAARICSWYISWYIGLPEPEMELAHTQAYGTLSFRTVEPPEHEGEIEVVDEGTGALLEKADVRLGSYRASTGEGGVARFEVATGSCDIVVRKSGFAAAPRTLKVAEDLVIRVCARAVTEKNPDDERVWM
jgi:hypothetical protein